MKVFQHALVIIDDGQLAEGADVKRVIGAGVRHIVAQCRHEQTHRSQRIQKARQTTPIKQVVAHLAHIKRVTEVVVRVAVVHCLTAGCVWGAHSCRHCIGMSAKPVIDDDVS